MHRRKGCKPRRCGVEGGEVRKGVPEPLNHLTAHSRNVHSGCSNNIQTLLPEEATATLHGIDGRQAHQSPNTGMKDGSWGCKEPELVPCTGYRQSRLNLVADCAGNRTGPEGVQSAVLPKG